MTNNLSGQLMSLETLLIIIGSIAAIAVIIAVFFTMFTPKDSNQAQIAKAVNPFGSGG